MRTTITLPDELHETLVSLARDRRVTVSRTIEELVRSGLRGAGSAGQERIRRDTQTDLLVIRLGRPVTGEDVRSLDDDE